MLGPKQPNVDIPVCDKPLSGTRLVQMTYRKNGTEYYEWNTFFHIIIWTNTLTKLPVVDVSLCLKVPAIYSSHHPPQHIFTPWKFQRPSRRTIRCHVGQNSRCIVTNLVQQSHNTVYRTHMWHSITPCARVLQMLKAVQPFKNVLNLLNLKGHICSHGTANGSSFKPHKSKCT